VWVEEKKTRWAELLDLWHQYWVFEPLNSGILGLTEPETKEKLSTLFHDMMTYDDTPFIVAVDRKTEKVVVLASRYSLVLVITNSDILCSVSDPWTIYVSESDAIPGSMDRIWSFT